MMRLPAWLSAAVASSVLFAVAAPGQTPPLDASYTYANLKLNVGLATRDFDATNPELFK